MHGRGALVALAWLLLLGLASAAPGTWFLQLPPTDFFTPDIDVSSPTPLPRVPQSPYGTPANVCPAANGVPYFVQGWPGTPYIATPFSDQYKSPPVGQPSATVCRTPLAGDPNPPHCMRAFDIEITAIQLRPFDNAIPSCRVQPPTDLLAYNGSIPGPTMIAPVGHETLVRFTNKVTGPAFGNIVEPLCTGTRHGRPHVIHLHGSASLAPYDGWAEDEICGGESKEYIYPNQRPTTAWYHDHAVHITLDNAYHGLAGFYLQSNKVKHGSCGEPYNLEDIEERLMMLRDAVLTPTCQLYFDFLGPHAKSLYGDINTINGVPWPTMPLEPKWYRFRFLNAAVSRPWLIKFKNEFGQDVGPQICRVIAADGGFRPDAISFPVEGLQMGVAERYEVVCNFARFAGKRLYIWNGRNDAMMKDVPYFCHSHLLALVDVAPTTVTPNPPAFNELLVPPSPLGGPDDIILSPADIAKARQMIAAGTPHRNFEFGRTTLVPGADSVWTINGQTWDTAKIAASDVGQNTWELWRLRGGGGWFHPVHVHLVDFFVLQRGAKAVPGAEGLFSFERNSPKDVVFLGPSNELWLIARYGAHRGDYMFHCHNLDHEDHDMMRAYSVVAAPGTPNAVSTLEPITTVAGVIYNNWGYHDPRLAAASARPTPTWPPLTDAYLQTQLDLNLYRIFYPNITDLPGLQPPANPWWSKVCNTLL